MHRFDPRSYGAASIPLLAGERRCPLGPGSPNAELRPHLAALDPAALFENRRVVDRESARACLAGLWLLHDFLDESHRISQDLDSATGSFWHAIMHRREPDFPNAKYWFERVGMHPVFEPLAVAARELAADHAADPAAAMFARQATWNPFAFVDLCEAVRRGRSSSERLCRDVARVEWELLFDDSYRTALGE